MAPVKWKGLDSQKNNQEEKGMQREYIGQMAELTGQEIRDITHGPRVICLFSAISCVCVGYSISSCVPAGGEGREGKRRNIIIREGEWREIGTGGRVGGREHRQHCK